MEPRRVRKTVPQSELKRARKGLRATYIVGIALLAVLVAFLAYGLLQHTVIHPRVDATIERTDLFVKAGEHIQVNVVNACGVSGMAGKFTEFLRARKFDVPEYSTSKQLQPFSRVIDRVGDSLSARKVAYALGISPERVESEIDSSLYLRATVVIGEDYRTLRPLK
jgi:hypothetical protein